MSAHSKKRQKMALLARIAWMYYVQGQTQEEIARKLDFSRTKVTRLLAKAKEAGVIQISINKRYRICFETEERMKEIFNLRDVRIAPTGGTTEETREAVGLIAAGYLESTLERNDVIGCTWGRSVYQVGRSLNPRRPRPARMTVVQLVGGMNSGREILPQKIMELMTNRLRAEGFWLNTPAVVSNIALKEALNADANIAKALEMARNCTKAVLGIGDISDTASLITTGSITLEENRELKEHGAVGDILSRHYDIDGTPVPSSIKGRVMSISLEELKAIPLRIGVTSGKERAPSILGALNGGYVNALMIDEETALAVLNLKEQRSGGEEGSEES